MPLKVTWLIYKRIYENKSKSKCGVQEGKQRLAV